MAQSPVVRRVRRRPTRSDVGTSGSAPSNSVPSSYDSTSVQDLDRSLEAEVDIPDLGEVQDLQAPSAPESFDPFDPTTDRGNTPYTPEEILMARAEGGRSTPTQIKMRRVMVARMMMRGIDIANMAKTLNVSESLVNKDIRAVKEAMISAADNLDIKQQVGYSMAFYRDIQYQSLRMATASGSSNAVKLAAFKTAMTAQADMARFFKLSGVFDVLPFIVNAQREKSDIERLTELTKAAMALDAPLEDSADSEYEESLQRYLAEMDKNPDTAEDDTELDIF